MSRLVSIIIPTFNRAALLPRGLKSLLKQTYQNFEIIVVDDGSTDNTEQIVKEFQRNDPRIQYVRQAHTGYAASPLNTGIKNSKGSHIAFLASDDEWTPTKLEKQIGAFDAQPNRSIGFISCYALLMDRDGKTLAEYRTPNPDSLFPQLLLDNFICGNVVIKKRVLDVVGLFDEALCVGEDWDMWIRIARAGYDFDVVNEPVFKYYLHESNITKSTNALKSVLSVEYIFKKHHDLYRKYRVMGKMAFSLGVKFYLANDQKRSRRYIKEVMRLRPFRPEPYLVFMLFYFGKLGYGMLTLLVKFYRIIKYRFVRKSGASLALQSWLEN